MANKKNSNKRKVQGKKKIETVDNFETDIWSKVFVIVGTICFLLAFYLLTLYITNKNSEDTDDADSQQEETTISTENIIAGKSLSMSDDQYLVIFYDKSDEDTSSTYSSLVSTYKSKSDHLKIYTVDMSNGLNKKFKTDGESNKNPSTESELKVNGPTLMVVSGHAVSEYIEGEEAISNYLK